MSNEQSNGVAQIGVGGPNRKHEHCIEEDKTCLSE